MCWKSRISGKTDQPHLLYFCFYIHQMQKVWLRESLKIISLSRPRPCTGEGSFHSQNTLKSIHLKAFCVLEGGGSFHSQNTLKQRIIFIHKTLWKASIHTTQMRSRSLRESQVHNENDWFFMRLFHDHRQRIIFIHKTLWKASIWRPFVCSTEGFSFTRLSCWRDWYRMSAFHHVPFPTLTCCLTIYP